jgi:hypothetical protein
MTWKDDESRQAARVLRQNRKAAARARRVEAARRAAEARPRPTQVAPAAIPQITPALPAAWQSERVQRDLRRLPRPQLLDAMVPVAEAQILSIRPYLVGIEKAARGQGPGPHDDAIALRYQLLLVTIGKVVTRLRHQVVAARRRAIRTFGGGGLQEYLDAAQLDVWLELWEAAQAIWHQYEAARRWTAPAAAPAEHPMLAKFRELDWSLNQVLLTFGMRMRVLTHQLATQERTRDR